CWLMLFLPLAAALPAEAAEAPSLSATPPASSSPSSSPVPAAIVSGTSSAAGQAKGGTEVVWEWDPYYSNVSLDIPLTGKAIPELAGASEFEVYRTLFAGSLVPRFMLVELAVMPMPLAGVALKKYTPDFYRGFNVGSSDLNLLESVTAGFLEPYAFSLFLGNMVNFVRPGEEKVGTNKGYMGYMVSYSNEHIKNNVLIPDQNVETEWKMKGERDFRDDKLSWSFRIGAKIHQNPDITNSYYLGFRRNNLDFKADFLSFLANSDVCFRWDFSARDGRPLRQEYIVGKKYPIAKWHVALRLDLGVVWEDPAEYTGPLRDRDFHNVTAVIRPNIEF
ncbi:MAG TPA: hypothetical protein VF795_03515, partial [Desulfuromonadaceae bacterium]